MTLKEHCLESAWIWATAFTMSLCTMKPTHCSFLSSIPLKNTLWPLKIFSHFNQRMFHLYRSVSYKSSSKLSAAVNVRTFHEEMVMSPCPWSLAPVAYIYTWHSRHGVRRGTRSLLCRATTDPVWICHYSLLSLVVYPGHSPVVPIPLQTAGLFSN